MNKTLPKIELTIVFILVALSFSFVFGYLERVTNLNPLKLYIACIVLTALLMMIRPSSFTYIFKLPIYRWILFYFVIVLIWIMLPNAHATDQDIRDILLSIIVLFTISTLMYFDDARLSASRKAILIVTLLSVIINVTEFFVPTLLFPQGTHVFGRSAGFYIGPSASAQAIAIGLILSYGIVWEKFKTLFLFAALIGIVFTFSRAGMASWFLIVLVFSLQKTINKKNILIILLIMFLGFLMLLPVLTSYIDNQLESSNLISRINPSSSSFGDSSTNERLEVAKAAWDYFADSPLIGQGISFTRHWEFSVLPHNTYLKLMAEYGIIGIFIFISLIFASTYIAKNEAAKIGKVFAIFTLMVGFSSHNILETIHFQIAFAFMANMSYRSRYSELEAGIV